ncbi:MAG TPA: tryptophan synthase subunit alpha [Usitatibacter sp.]|nr:tryptophan synthase subunit alpha [Usitatibacter sp.]
MSRIAKAFEKLISPSPSGAGRGEGPGRSEGAKRRSALIPFVTAGDPAPSQTVPILHALVKAGADVIELGVPFSDPMADGPVIQRSSERALRNGVSLRDVLAMVAEFRTHDPSTPVVLMGYANPIERMGLAAFVSAASQAGVDGVLIVDYPPEESGEWLRALEGSGIDPIFLLSPTSSEARIASVAKLAQGYIYYVSLKGVTGAAHIDTKDVESMLARIRRHTKIPVGVGFGIRDAETARKVGRVADAVVIGSRIVQELEEGAPGAAPERARKLIAEFRAAMDSAASSSTPVGTSSSTPVGTSSSTPAAAGSDRGSKK